MRLSQSKWQDWACSPGPVDFTQNGAGSALTASKAEDHWKPAPAELGGTFNFANFNVNSFEQSI